MRARAAWWAAYVVFVMWLYAFAMTVVARWVF